ncbi:helix-turn-helix transcriptional regulator [Actinoallomurus rhizosphaericola]|uniref:helix-turn-helix transcriptional regulator n=1 Tax=Actinoallomurus rhizosphaericola TaxID=2952536 RepID=UPI002093155D|nr:YafY family protein [Actinoallomurus rhizosphaericola]MCO5997451.1 YafY family transcriptional regulator [Actinoallomurus rhizosphaericola]
MTAARLLTLLSLLQTPREWPGSELAERMGVSPRTVRRDVERLRDLGYPVEATMGPAGGYRLVAGTAMPPLLVDDEEAVAIAVALSTAAAHPVGGMAEASLRALTKLEQVLPSRLRHRVGALNAATVALLGEAGPTIDPDDLTTVAVAAASHRRLRFAYRSREDRAREDPDASAAADRLVEPYRLVAAGRRWYLVAYDLGREDWRIFRMDRVRRPRPTGVPNTPRRPPEEDAAAYVTRKLHSVVPTYRALVTLHLPADDAPASRLGEVEPVDARTCRLRTHADTLDWLALRLAMLGCEFTVHEPPELIEYLRSLSARVLRATDDPAT